MSSVSRIPGEDPVSVVIPCYNCWRFLGEAIESVLAQTHPHVEPVVIDDGSSDDTAAVSARYRSVRYVRQENQGVSAARNRGIRESSGEYLLFLDADDRLLPRAIEVNLGWLKANPGWAFVFGEHRYIDLGGRLLREWTRPGVTTDYYSHLLAGNAVGMCATALFRRSVFETVGFFDSRLDRCEDWELFLRIARRFPVGSHNETVAEYRRYPASTTGSDPARMLSSAMCVLRSQRPFVGGNRGFETAYAKGLAHWRSYYGEPLASQIRQRWSRRANRLGAARDALVLLRYAPLEFARLLAGRVSSG